MTKTKEQRLKISFKTILLGIVVNLVLSAVKCTTGVLGNSQALIADGIESLTDVFTSFLVLIGITLSVKPPDAKHPYGHGKFEPLSALFVSLCIFFAAFFIAVESIQQIRKPHALPEFYTLYVLIVTICIKEFLFAYSSRIAKEASSSSLKIDSWHHRSDAITSFFACIGISLSLYFGEGYESLDDYAALLSSLCIAFNGIILMQPSLLELIDTTPDPELRDHVRKVAETVDGVLGTHKCHVRKLGFDYYIDLDILCNPTLTIREGHDISHEVGKAIKREIPYITKVLVHVEPIDDYGRR